VASLVLWTEELRKLIVRIRDRCHAGLRRPDARGSSMLVRLEIREPGAG